MRDIGRNIAGEDELHEAFVRPLYLAERVLTRTAISAVAKSTACARGGMHRQGKGAQAL
jgi:hypothetical protein